MTQKSTPYIVTFLLIVGMALWLLYAGREPISPSGTVDLREGDPLSPENSKGIWDWYTLSHIIHGFLFYGALWVVASRLSFGWRLAIATGIEVAWEIVENSNAVIERYRTTTVSTEYSGDSVLNSVSDVVMMIVGFWLASKLPVWVTVVLILAFEALTMWLIRDGLALNVLMLIYPLDAVRDWQAGG